MSNLDEMSLLTQKLATPSSNLSHSTPLPKKTQENGGWSFIQAITNPSNNNIKQGSDSETDDKEVYIHPLEKRSYSTLSKKSLEMCTEILGSESGSDFSKSSDEFTSMLMEKQKSHGVQRSLTKKVKKQSVNFPPPLTSNSSSGGVQVRCHREGGRLVIRAVTISSSSPCFLAKRANGRLMLTLFKDSNLNNCDNNELIENENADKVEGWKDEMKGNAGKVEFEVFTPMPRRCKEGGENDNKNWGTFWVPIS